MTAFGLGICLSAGEHAPSQSVIPHFVYGHTLVLSLILFFLCRLTTYLTLTCHRQ